MAEFTQGPTEVVAKGDHIRMPVTRIAAGGSVQSPRWLRARVRALVIQADTIVGECRALAGVIERLAREQAQARQALRNLDIEREALRRRPLLAADGASVMRDVAAVDRDKAAQAERLTLIEEELAAVQAQLDQRGLLRTQARQSLGAILGALPDGGALQTEASL